MDRTRTNTHTFCTYSSTGTTSITYSVIQYNTVQVLVTEYRYRRTYNGEPILYGTVQVQYLYS